MSLSFHDWERFLIEKEQKVVTLEVIENEEEALEDIEEEKPEENKTTTIDPETQEFFDSLKKLCRICGSNGLININALVTRASLKFPPSGDIRLWEVPISNVIEDISGEKVSTDDFLPQFICEHCLGYLQHAYEMRLKIRSNSANLRMVHQIANGESISLETAQIDQKKITKREVAECDEELNEEKHFFDKFRGSNIKIKPNSTTRHVERAIEHHCPSCKKRIMSIKSLNEHMEFCAESVINSFFGLFQTIYSMRVAKKLTTNAFIIHAIKLVYETYKKLREIVKEKNIDVDAISSELPPSEFSMPLQAPQNFRRPPYNSPDNGYASGTCEKSTYR